MTLRVSPTGAGENLLPARRPLLYAITERYLLPGREMSDFLGAAARAGLDLIQIRERDLAGRRLLTFVQEGVSLAAGTEARIFVNDRLDVALAGGAAGVHLPARGLPATEVRRSYSNILIGASTHNVDELRRAEDGGANFAVFGPVFAPTSKKSAHPPVGVGALAEAATAVEIPVLALGGVTEENARECVAAGAAGVAGISLFQASPNLAATVKRLRTE